MDRRADELYLTKYIERMGTGIHDMIARCHEAGLAEPEFKLIDGFVTVIRRNRGRRLRLSAGRSPNKSPRKLALSRHQVQIRHNCLKEQTISDLMKHAGRTDRTKFRNQVLRPLLNAGFIEMTIPDKPRSSK